MTWAESLGEEGWAEISLVPWDGENKQLQATLDNYLVSFFRAK